VRRCALLTTTVLAIACSVVATTPMVALAQHLAVVNKSSNSLSLIDPVTRKEVAEIPTGYSPHEVGISPDGVFAYVTDYGTGPEPGNTITVIDLGETRPVAKIDLGSHTRPHGIAVANDGTIWVTTEGSRHLLHIDPLSQRILQEVQTSQEITHQVAVSEKHGRAFTANIGSGNVTVVDAVAGTVVTHITTGAGAEGIDVSPDGERVYVANRQAGTLSEIDVRTNRVLRTLRVGDFPIRVKVRPDGSEALVSNARGSEVVAVNLVGWRVVRRLPIGAFPVGILITPDNRTAYVANTGDDRISVIDLVNWRLDGEMVAGDEPDGMAWVPAAPPQLNRN
jgi:YVTN family beta-propeller protein